MEKTEYYGENMKQDAGKPYVLPPWRMNEILLLAAETLSTEEFYKDGFDYKKMIRDKGIKIRKFSSFTPDNLAAFMALSLSGWKEGICALFPDPETGGQCRMIAYDDGRTPAECMQIIFHEYGHIVLRHTQQSVNGEVEATCFALAMSLLVILEQQFHVAKDLTQVAGKGFFLQGLKNAIRQKEAV